MRMSLRRQIFLWYALVTPVIVVGLAFTAQKVMVEGLRATIDQHLQERTEIVASTIVLNPAISPTTYKDLVEWLTEQQLPYVPAVLRISDPQHRVIATFGDIPDSMIPIMDRQLFLPALVEGRFETVKVRGHDALRIYTIPVYHPSSGATIVLVQTGDSLAAVVEAQQNLWRYTIVVGIGGSALMILTGFFILQRGFRPLDKILSRARGISAENLAVRISEEPRPPELQQLTDTLNSMLQRLQTAFQTRETFVASVSHDLRTPITVIQGQIDVLLMHRSLDKEARHSLERMARETQRLSRMTSNLLLSAQMVSQPVLTPGEVDLRELLDEVNRGARLLAEDLTLTALIPGIIIVPGDYDLLKQMVLNVVDNAIKFTPKGGNIELTLDQDEKGVLLRVSDNGPGISKEHLTHIFEPFYKAGISRKPGHGGTGLGLAIVKKIIELHNGWVSIDTKEGVGTTVTMWLPRGLPAGPGQITESPL